MIAYAKSLSDESLFHPLLECLLSRVITTATEECKMMLCQVITEFILPDIWKVTRLPGNYGPLKVLWTALELNILGNNLNRFPRLCF